MSLPRLLSASSVALLCVACATTGLAQDASPEGPGLDEVRCAELSEELGAIGPLERLSVDEVSALVLASRELPETLETEAREARYSEGGALPPRPAMSVAEHERRVRARASWCVAEPSGEGAFEGEVVNITNAKTLSVRPTAGGQIQRVALVGVQTPFEDQFGGPQALDLVRSTLERADMRVTVVPVNKSGRNLFAVVLVPEESGSERVEPLGELLLRHGLAWWNERYASMDERLRALHYGARDGRIGMYAREDVVSPRTFDRLRRKQEQGYRFDGQDVRARVVNVSDGDTLDVEIEPEVLAGIPGLAEFADRGAGTAGGSITIRLAGVDTPEIDQPGGVRAWVLTSLVCPVGEDVTLILSDEGGYGRVAARVICADGELLGEKLARTGLARHYEYYVPDKRLASLEDRARYAKVGLWSSPLSIVPGAWRDLHIDVHGLWVFDGDKHYLVVDADCDLSTKHDQERITSSRFRDEFARERFDRLSDAWRAELVPSER